MTESEFTTLYSGVAPALWTWARLRIGPRLGAVVDAEDLMQEICFQGFRSRDGFETSSGDFRNWMFGIANNVLKGLLRDMARRPATFRAPDSKDVVAQLPIEATTISRRAARDEELKRFLEGVQGLTEQERQLVIYRGLEGLPYAQVAALTGIDGEEAVRKRWVRLQERLAWIAQVAGLLAT